MEAFHQGVTQVGMVWALLLTLGFLAAALRGPTLLDRVLAIDALGICVIAVLALNAIHHGERAYLDAAMVLGLLALIGTVAAARYLERGGLFR